MRPPKPILVFIVMLASFGVLFLAARSKGASISVGVQALAIAAVAILSIFGVFALLARFQHRRLAKVSSFTQAQEKEGGGWLAGILALLVAMAVSKWSFMLLEYLVICYVYGRDAWLHGLRVVPAGARHGVFSNGDTLSGWPSLILNFGTFIAAAIFGLGSFLLFRYIGFRLQGKRLNDHAA
jgi:hypothetical protein